MILQILSNGLVWLPLLYYLHFLATFCGKGLLHIDNFVRLSTPADSFLSDNQCTSSGSNVLASTFVLTAILLLLSPVLQTLSKATTSDSIWPLSASLFALNAILADYGSEPQEPWQPIQ